MTQLGLLFSSYGATKKDTQIQLIYWCYIASTRSRAHSLDNDNEFEATQWHRAWLISLISTGRIAVARWTNQAIQATFVIVSCKYPSKIYSDMRTALENGSSGIRCNAVSPSYVSGPMMNKFWSNLQKSRRRYWLICQWEGLRSLKRLRIASYSYARNCQPILMG